MNIYEYIENSQLSYPFMSDRFLNTTVDNPTSTAEFQDLLKNYIYENFGIYQISPLIVMRENSTEKTFDDIISENSFDNDTETSVANILLISSQAF